MFWAFYEAHDLRKRHVAFRLCPGRVPYNNEPCESRQDRKVATVTWILCDMGCPTYFSAERRRSIGVSSPCKKMATTEFYRTGRTSSYQPNLAQCLAKWTLA